MNKEQSADDPPWNLIRKKYGQYTILPSYPDVVIACIEHKASLGSIQSN